MTSIAKKFSFVSLAPTLTADTFDVVSFSGTEGLSKLYRFEVILVSENDTIDLEMATQSRASLTILRDNGNIVFNGILSALEQMGTEQGRTQYRAELTPAFWRHTLTHHNQIFLDQTVPEIIESAMQSCGLTSLDYEFRITGSYLPHEYICQYSESLYSFISRLMEREGLYYYFEQDIDSEKVIITDTALLHSVMTEGTQLYYSPLSGLDETSREEIIHALVCRQKILPARVLLKDYNYRTPSLELTAECVVSARGQGDVYIYGEHFATPEEGARLAQIRADELKCRAKTFHGESLIPYLRPGYLFSLDGHNRADFNTTYLTMEITHHGDQTFLFTSGLDTAVSARERSPYYRNSFSAITSDCQFRPQRKIEKPRIAGTMNAHVDATGSGQYAEVDDQGRYKVILPFELNSAMDGKASSWLRMAQPYAGENHGMHFPLHKGTEVLLTFIDGDPDRPIIAAAVPNPVTPSPVTSANATQSRITTAGGNKLHMEDQQGGERILLQTPKQNSWIRMGTPNDPPGTPTTDGNEGIKLSTAGAYQRECAVYNSLTLGEEMSVVAGSSYSLLAGTETSITVGSSVDLSLGFMADASYGGHIDWTGGAFYTSSNQNELVGRQSVSIRAAGDSTLLNGLMEAIVALSIVDTLVVAGLGTLDCLEDIQENADNQSTFAKWSDGVYIGLLGALEIAALVAMELDGPSYTSNIELNAAEIELTSPSLVLKTPAGCTGKAALEKTATDTAAENAAAQLNLNKVPNKGEDFIEAAKKASAAAEAAKTALATCQEGNILLKAFLHIENTANGKISNTAKTDGIINTATAGGIKNTATAGGITNTAAAGDISNTATLGNLTNTAGLNLTNEATGTITNKGAINNLTATNALSIKSETGAITVDATTTITMNSNKITIEAWGDVDINGATSVAINGALVKLG